MEPTYLGVTMKQVTIYSIHAAVFLKSLDSHQFCIEPQLTEKRDNGIEAAPSVTDHESIFAVTEGGSNDINCKVSRSDNETGDDCSIQQSF